MMHGQVVAGYCSKGLQADIVYFLAYILEVPFQVLLRRQIAWLLNPSLQCVHFMKIWKNWHIDAIQWFATL